MKINTHIKQLHPYQPGKNIEAVMAEHGIEHVIKLASNENPLGCSTQVQKALKTFNLDLALYPDGDASLLRHKIAKQLGVKTEQIVLGNGSDTLFEAILKITVDPEEDHVLLSEYAFIAYPIACKGLNIPYKTCPSQNYAHDINAMLAATTEKTRVIFIANPNNPTGTFLNHDQIANFLNALPQSTYLVLDEAYYEYSLSHDAPRSIELLAQYPNLIITRTFSKAYGLAGIRLGYAITHPEIANYLNRVRLPFNTSSIAQSLALIALEDQDHIAKSIEVNKQGMQQWSSALEKMQIPFISGFGNFLLIDCEKEAMNIFEECLRQGVIFRPLLPYQLPRHLRISIGTEADNAIAINILKNSLEK